MKFEMLWIEQADDGTMLEVRLQLPSRAIPQFAVPSKLARAYFRV
jgi:hypothetical protein